MTFQAQSVQFSCSVESDFLWHHGLQHSRLPCLSPTLGACSNSCPLSRWCHPTISFSVIPFFSCLRSFPASGSFLMSQLFTSGDQSIGVSASATVLPMNIQDLFPLEWTGWISLPSKGLSRVFSNTTIWKHQFFHFRSSLWSNSHIHTITHIYLETGFWNIYHQRFWICPANYQVNLAEGNSNTDTHTKVGSETAQK